MEHLKSRQPPPTLIEDKSSRHHTKQYKVNGYLGKGGFANVYRVQSVDSNKIYACKVINKSKLVHHEHKRKLVSEIKLHQSLQHKNIVLFERHFEDTTNVYILLECCSNKSLMELSIRRSKLTQHEVRYFMLQILTAINYLHTRSIIHRDLKLGNILLSKDLTLKICDFGLAAKLEFDSERKTTICGTPNYTAPEILNQRRSGEGHSYEVDYWSIGVIMFTLLTGKPPFETKNIKETYRRIKRIKYEFPLNSDKYIPVEAKDLISKIFTKEPSKRPNLKQIGSHSFFKNQPIPQRLPQIILKRAPTNKELFPIGLQKEENKNNNQHIQSQNSKKRAPLISTGYKRVNNYNYHQHQHMKYNDINIMNSKQINKKLGLQPNQNQMENEIVNEHGKDLQISDFISIIKYVDYTKKYGFGYILSNGSTGIFFNDSTKILLHPNKENVVYVNNGEIKQNCTMVNYPNCLKKKLTLLKHFADYLWKCDDDKKEKEKDEIRQQLNTLKKNINGNNHNIYLKTYICDHYCILFKLSNNMVQVNFTDKSQIMIMDKFVLYKDKIGNRNIFKLNQLHNSNKKDLKKRCKYTQQLLQKITSKKSNK